MGKFSFMHLISPGGSSRVDDDPEDKRDGENAEEEEERRESRRARSRADDDNGDDVSTEDDDGDEENVSTEDDDGDEGNARASERERCAAIFATSYAAKNPALAAELAFNTRLSVKQARAVMKAALEGAAGKKGGLSARMRNAPQPGTGRDVRTGDDRNKMAQHAMALYREARGRAAGGNQA